MYAAASGDPAFMPGFSFGEHKAARHRRMPICRLHCAFPVQKRERRCSNRFESRFRCGLLELSMPTKAWTPWIAPKGDDQNVYLVVDDFGRNGRAYREADVETTELETVVAGLLDGQYKNP